MISSQLTLYLTLLLIVLCSLTAVPLLNSPDNMFTQKGDKRIILPLILTVVCTFWFGGRQLFMGGFVDTSNYAREYINLVPNFEGIKLFSGEWIWSYIMQFCKWMDFSPRTFFTIIVGGYLVTLLFALKIFMPRNPTLAILFAYSSLFFLPFGVNGIRNGLACHLVLLAFALLFDSKRAIAFIVMFIAFGIHRSTLLPMAAVFAALYVFKDVEYYIYFWLLTIPLSFFASGYFINLFASLGFDDRMASYGTDLDTGSFSHSGFRWDFLLYSCFPVIMIWYVCVKRRISDTWYNALSITYLLCNAFWVLVITASYSNRFAYLSWFLYPFVIAYPLIMLPVWHDQDQKSGIILIAYLGFTIVMNLLWHSY